MKTLVFLEHHEGEIQKGSLGVLGKAVALGGDVAGVLAGAGVGGLAEEAGRHGAATVWVADDERLGAPLPQPRVDVLAQLVRDEGFDTVLFAQSVLAADVAAGLAARLDAGLNWDLVDLNADGVGTRPALSDSVYVDVGWVERAAARDLPVRARSIPCRPAERPRSRRRRSSSRTSRCSPRWSSRRTPSSKARRSRRPT